MSSALKSLLMSLPAAVLVVACGSALGYENGHGSGTTTCTYLLDAAVDGMVAFDPVDFVNSSDPAGEAILKSHLAFVGLEGVPNAYVVLAKSVDDCKSDGCAGTLVGFSRGFGYASAPFVVENNSGAITTVGGFERQPVWPVELTLESALSNVVVQVSTDALESYVYYAPPNNPIEDAAIWTSYGGIPRYLFGDVARGGGSRFSCVDLGLGQ